MDECLLYDDTKLYDVLFPDPRQQASWLGMALLRDFLRRNVLIQAEEIFGIVV